MISRTSSLRLAVAALTLAVGLALAGCGSMQPGTAAQVGDEKISMSFLNDQLEWYQENTDQGEPPTSKLLVWQLVVSRLYVVTADRVGVTTSPAELSQVESSIKSRNLASPGMLSTIAQGSVLEGKLQEQLGDSLQDEVLKTSHELGVTLNPRIGVWNDNFLRTGPDSFGSGALVKPSAQPEGEQPGIPIPVPQPEQ